MPTTNPVPSQDPSDLLFNAGKLDEVLNGTGNSFTDRLGNARRTVAGMNYDFDAQLADAESDLNVYRADAAASASLAQGYLNTIRATSYGAYASDPETDPLGNPPTVGDEYFNTTANLLKRWNGTTWQASDINTANLAASSGSSLVGYDGGTVQDVLDAVTGDNGAASVGYTPAGTGAVATTVQSKLLETVSIFDYMTAAQVEDSKSGGGTIDLTTVIQTAVSKCVGKIIQISDGDYTFGLVNPPSGTTICGNGKSTRVKLKSGANSQLFAGSSISDVSIYNIAFDGNKANQTTAANLFQFLNCDNINIYSCYIKNATQDGAYFSGCTNSAAYFNVVEDNGRNGISLGAAAGTSTNVKVLYNKISGHSAANSIGISFEPAYKCQAIGNILIDNYDGINVAGDAAQTINCNENEIIGNNISASAACNRGIIVAGVSATTNENHIAGNKVKGNYTRGFVALTTSGNTITENDAIGLTGSSTGFEFTLLAESVVSGNKSKNNQLYGFFFDNCSDNTVSGNHAKNNSLLNPGVRDGIRFEGGSNNVVTGNHSSGASQSNGIKENGAVVTNTYAGNHVYGNAGAGYSIVPTSGSSVDGRLYATASPVTITGTNAETDLQSTLVPANVHKSYSGIRIRAAGTKSGSAGNKQLKLYFGASSVIFNPAANNANDWRLEAEIMFLGATTQRVTLVGFDGTSFTQDYSVTNIDTAAAATTVKCTGVLGNAADSIVGMLFSVEYIR